MSRDGARREARDWFEALFGFREFDADVRATLVVDGGELVSPINGARYAYGAFSTPSLAELRAAVAAAAGGGAGGGARPSTFANVVGDAAGFHARFPGATFQVASQFNCLEFVGPGVVPEDGVTGYAGDRTQGPCCAIACGAATVYRNYYALAGGAAQSREAQIENLGPLLAALGPPARGSFTVRGGYTLADDAALAAYGDALASSVGINRRSTAGLGYLPTPLSRPNRTRFP